MRYGVNKISLPWGNVVILEAPYLFEVLPPLGRDVYRYIVVTAKAPVYVIVRSPNSQSVYPFERSETDELERFLEQLELVAVEQVLEGGAQIARLPALRDVRLDELLDWVDSRPNALTDRAADDAEVMRRYAAVRLLCVFSNLYLPTRFLSVRQFVFSSTTDSVTYLEEPQILLRRVFRGRNEYLLVARGADLEFAGEVEINRRKKYPVLDALVRGGFVAPARYSGALRRAQEHPALELRRRRGFAGGTVLYERRLLGTTIDYVVVRGTKIGRGVTPRQALLDLGG